MVSLQDRLNKLQTLAEDLENVNIQDTTPTHRVIKRSRSVQYMPNSSQGGNGGTTGLGLAIPPRRPSDNMLRRASSKLSILERPVSNDSILSTTGNSEYSEDNVNDSRNSSMTSGSIGDSPIAKNSNFSTNSIDQGSSYGNLNYQNQISQVQKQLPSTRLRHAASTPKLFPSYHNNRPYIPSSNLSTSQLTNMSTASLSTLNLTPSQKLRLKRQNSKSSSKSTIINEREKYYDLNSDEDDSTLEDGLIWNVPYTRGTANIFSPSSGTNPTLIKSIMEQSPVTMPLSPLPGNCSAPFSPLGYQENNNSQVFDEAQYISNFYQVSSENYVKHELENRKNSSVNLPIMIKEASTLGLDDMKLVSEEKARSLSSTRPVWLPPKSTKESLKHEKDVTKMLEKAAKLDKLKHEQQIFEIKTQEFNKTRWNDLVKRGPGRNSSQSEMKKICLRTIIPDHLRYEVWSVTLNKYKSSNMEIETFNELNKKFASLPSDIPSSKIQELKDLINDVFDEKTNKVLHERLLKLMKLLMISKISVVQKFDEYLLGLLLLKFNEIDSLNLFYMIKVLIFNETAMKKFDSNLSKNSIMNHQFKSKEFKPDLENLTSFKIMKILSNFNDAEVVYQFFDILILNNNYKILYCLILTVLKDFHFGFNELDDLISEKNKGLKLVNVSNHVHFFDRFNHYYKKFF